MKEALKLALEALENERPYLGPMPTLTIKAITAIKEALANHIEDNLTMVAQPEQEPVAWIGDDGNLYYEKPHEEYGPEPTPLYITPQQRTWVGLTEEEVEACFHHVDEAGIGLFDFAEAIEAKLKEKNT